MESFVEYSKKKGVRYIYMSEKRYQVFISSTFTDLVKERKAIMEAILNLDCFPSGMEMFPASDMEQFEYIQSIIDVSDYYVLVVAGKYGSMSEETGISYTEMEYDYAKEKGIPIITFIKKDIDSIERLKIDLEPDKVEKLTEFRNKISKNKLVKYWDDCNELKYNVHDSLSKAIKIHKRCGWVRGDIATDTELLRQINILRTENEKLKKSLLNDIQKDKLNKSMQNLSQADDEYKISYNITFYGFAGEEHEKFDSVTFTWDDLFYLIGYKLLSSKRMAMQSAKSHLNTLIGYNIMENDLQNLDIPDKYKEDTEIEVSDENLTTILLQLAHLNLIKEDNSGYIYLSEEGKNIIANRLLVKKTI